MSGLPCNPIVRNISSMGETSHAKLKNGSNFQCTVGRIKRRRQLQTSPPHSGAIWRQPGVTAVRCNCRQVGST